MPKRPEDPICCLMVHPKFSRFNYWNYVDACELVGAKTNQPPLGLLTVAALLPEHWQIKLVDLNVSELTPYDWQWADIVLTGGMLPQQKGICEIINKAKADGKYVVVGGPDPTSQPDVYKEADAIVMGEGELTIPRWLSSWMGGKPHGSFSSDDKPDVTETPIPRYELINFDDYLHIGVQYSRGCPFNCEFCDIIELYGRKPRIKTTQQFLNELDHIYNLGYRGWVDIVDDNFIGNKRNIKKMLPELNKWNKERGFPFYFSTEASMNLGDDERLLFLMQRAEFRYVFIGIETPDPELLMMTQKSQNTMRPITQRIDNIYRFGISVAAGFIIGFDNEKKGTDLAIIECIRETGIVMAMVGMLVALPNTQLTRRLHRESRLLAADGSVVKGAQSKYNARIDELAFDADDNTTGGLNFITTRERDEIYDEYLNVIQTVYSPKEYFDRVIDTTKRLNIRRRHLAKGKELRRNIMGALKMMVRFSMNSTTRWYFWRNFFQAMRLGIFKFEYAMNMMGTYLHFQKQTRYLVNHIPMQKRVFGSQITDQQQRAKQRAS